MRGRCYSMDSVRCKNYIRVRTEDKPKVLASIATAFGDNNVSIESPCCRKCCRTRPLRSSG